MDTLPRETTTAVWLSLSTIQTPVAGLRTVESSS